MFPDPSTIVQLALIILSKKNLLTFFLFYKYEQIYHSQDAHNYKNCYFDEHFYQG